MERHMVVYLTNLPHGWTWSAHHWLRGSQNFSQRQPTTWESFSHGIAIASQPLQDLPGLYRNIGSPDESPLNRFIASIRIWRGRQWNAWKASFPTAFV